MAEPSDRKAEEFLGILSDRIEELLEVSRLPQENPQEINFDDYQKFRDMMGECLSFLIIIERRINLTGEDRRKRLLEQFDSLTVAVWSILLDGSLSFLTVICEKEFLPLGTRHVFVQELRTLYDAEQVLKEDKYENYLMANVVEQRDKAERILNAIIDRAPQLLNLG
jgi:hypothetical protein